MDFPIIGKLTVCAAEQIVAQTARVTTRYCNIFKL